MRYKLALNKFLRCSFLWLVPSLAFADVNTFTQSATDLTDGIASIAYTIFYITGFVFLLMGLVKIKKHRQNPMQIHLSMVFVDFFVSVCMFCLPYFAMHSNQAIFGLKDKQTASKHKSLPNFNTPTMPPGAELLTKEPPSKKAKPTQQ